MLDIVVLVSSRGWDWDFGEGTIKGAFIFLYIVMSPVKIYETHVFVYRVHGRSSTLGPRDRPRGWACAAHWKTPWAGGNAYALKTILRKDCTPEQSQRCLKFRHLPVMIKLIMKKKKKKSLVKVNFSWFGSLR